MTSAVLERGAGDERLSGAAEVPPATPGPARSRGRRGVQTATVAAIGFAVAGLIVGLRPIHDNSFLTHLATGRLLLHGTFPRHDPYSFTAHGAGWVVESWLPSLLYALIERAVGSSGLMVLQGFLSMALAMLAWRLARRAGSLAGRELLMILFLFVNVGLWTPRPLMIGLLCLGTTILLAEDDTLPIWLLLPVGWIWVNSHGSWPLGIGYLLIRLVGRRIDRGQTARLWRLLRWSAAGVCAGALGPVGPQMLLFPFHLLARHSILTHIAEWQSPPFTSLANVVFLVGALGAIALASRGGWEDSLPSILFTAMALTSARNMSVATLVLLPVVARHIPGVPARRPGSTSRGPAIAVAALLLIGAMVTARVVTRPAFDLRPYPVAEMAWMRSQGLLERRLAAPDFVGNYRTWAEGAHGEVFIDDRYDMYPPPVAEASFELDGRPGWDTVLDRFNVDVVLWQRHSPLAQLLARDSRWVVVHQTVGWVVAERVTSTRA